MWTTSVERFVITALVTGIGLNESLHAIFDGLQFAANVEFVRDVLSMKATIEPNSWRAMNGPVAAFVAYALIWTAHAVGGLLCLLGAYRLGFGHSHAETSVTFALITAGVGLGCALYLVGFVAIAGGWFLLYTAPTPPNFTNAAMMLFLCYLAVLIYVAISMRRSEPMLHNKVYMDSR